MIEGRIVHRATSPALSRPSFSSRLQVRAKNRQAQALIRLWIRAAAYSQPSVPDEANSRRTSARNREYSGSLLSSMVI